MENVDQTISPLDTRRVSPLRRRIGLALLVVCFSIVISFAAGRLRTYQVTSASMLPTIRIGDRILVDARKTVVLHRGDIVALADPEDPDFSEGLCKRIVAIPSDNIAIRNGYFVINDVVQDKEPYVRSHRLGVPDMKPRKLGIDEYFVLGDNRGNSVDSSIFGPVPRHEIIGVARYLYWPIGRAHVFKNPGMK